MIFRLPTSWCRQVHNACQRPYKCPRVLLWLIIKTSNRYLRTDEQLRKLTVQRPARIGLTKESNSSKYNLIQTVTSSVIENSNEQVPNEGAVIFQSICDETIYPIPFFNLYYLRISSALHNPLASHLPTNQPERLGVVLPSISTVV